MELDSQNPLQHELDQVRKRAQELNPTSTKKADEHLESEPIVPPLAKGERYDGDPVLHRIYKEMEQESPIEGLPIDAL